MKFRGHKFLHNSQDFNLFRFADFHTKHTRLNFSFHYQAVWDDPRKRLLIFILRLFGVNVERCTVLIDRVFIFHNLNSWCFHIWVSGMSVARFDAWLRCYILEASRVHFQCCDLMISKSLRQQPPRKRCVQQQELWGEPLRSPKVWPNGGIFHSLIYVFVHVRILFRFDSSSSVLFYAKLQFGTCILPFSFMYSWFTFILNSFGNFSHWFWCDIPPPFFYTCILLYFNCRNFQSIEITRNRSNPTVPGLPKAAERVVNGRRSSSCTPGSRGRLVPGQRPPSDRGPNPLGGGGGGVECLRFSFFPQTRNKERKGKYCGKHWEAFFPRCPHPRFPPPLGTLSLWES